MNHRKTTGYTLTELLLALFVVSMISLGIAGVATSLANAYESGEKRAESLQSARAAMLRMQSTIREAKLVCGAIPTAVILWDKDINRDGVINLNELAVLEYYSDRRLNKIYLDLPDTLSESARASYETPLELDTIVDSPVAIIMGLRSQVYTRIQPLAEDVDSMEFTFDASPPMSKTVQLNITVGVAGKETTLRSACSLRADETRFVIFSDGSYDLQVERILMDEELPE